MATSNIVIRQSDNNATPGSRDDLVLGTTVTLLNANDTGVTTWFWQFLDIPNGSSVVLLTPTQAIATFTPDVVGTYLIRLTVNGSIYSSVGAAVKTAKLHFRIPAVKEEGEFDQFRGWGTAVNAALKAIDDGYGQELLPDQTGHVGEFLSTDGSSTLWDVVSTTKTLSAAYADGQVTADSTLFLDSTRGGFRIFDNATPLGPSVPLFKVASSNGSIPYAYAGPDGGALLVSGGTEGISTFPGQVAMSAGAGSPSAQLGVIDGFGIFTYGPFVPAASDNLDDIGTIDSRYRTGWFATSIYTPKIDCQNPGTLTLGGTASVVAPGSDNTVNIGSTTLRYKSLHLGPGSLIIHNDNTDNRKLSLNFSGNTGQLIASTISTGNGTAINVQAGQGSTATLSGQHIGGGLFLRGGIGGTYDQFQGGPGGQVQLLGGTGAAGFDDGNSIFFDGNDGGSVTIRGGTGGIGTTSTTSGNGGNLTLTAGSAGSGPNGASGGNLTIDAGSQGTGGFNGIIQMGLTYARTIQIGSTINTNSTYINGNELGLTSAGQMTINAGTLLALYVDNANRWQIGADGHLIPEGAYNIGSSSLPVLSFFTNSIVLKDVANSPVITTGDMTAGSTPGVNNVINNVANNSGFFTGQSITVSGAGLAGFDLVSTVASVDLSSITINDFCQTTVTGATVTGVVPATLPSIDRSNAGIFKFGGVATTIEPSVDNVTSLGTTALRYKTLHLGPDSLIIHNDNTDTKHLSIGFVPTTDFGIIFNDTSAGLIVNGNGPLYLIADGFDERIDLTAGLISFNASGSTRMQMSASSLITYNLDIKPSTDGTKDLGGSGQRWRTGYFGTSVITPTIDRATSGALTFGSNITQLTVPKIVSTFTDSNPYTQTLSVGNVAGGVWTKIAAGDPSPYADWYHTFNSFSNPTFNDDVVRMGWNVNPGGGVVTAGRAALFDSWESYYNGGHVQSERHLSWTDTDGYETRFISFEGHIDDGSTSLYIASLGIQLSSGRSSNDPASLSINSTTTRLTSPSGLRSVMCDDDGGGTVIISNGVIGNTSRAQIVLTSAGSMVLSTSNSSVGSIGDINANQGNFRWDPNTSFVYSPDAATHMNVDNGQISMYVSGAPLLFLQPTQVYIPGKHIFIQIDGGGTNTRGDQIEAILIRNNTAATGIATQQFSPSIVQTGYGWTGSANRAVSFETQVQPDGAGNGKYSWLYSNDESNYTTEVASVTNAGTLSAIAFDRISSGALNIGTTNGTSGQLGVTASNAGRLTWGANPTGITMTDGTGAFTANANDGVKMSYAGGYVQIASSAATIIGTSTVVPPTDGTGQIGRDDLPLRWGSISVLAVYTQKVDRGDAGTLTLGGTATVVAPGADNTVSLGEGAHRFSNSYVTNTHSSWYDTIKGAQLTVSSNTITPTSGLHHVNATGGVTINTIDTTNVPASSTVELTIIADSGAITLGTTNIKVGGAVAQDTAQKLVWDGSFWYLVA